MSQSLYKEELMDHFRYPRNKKSLQNPDVFAGDDNPSCGDKVAVECKIKNNKIVEIGFNGSGCVISQATASMFYNLVLNKTIDEVLKFTKDDLLKLIGLELGPNRLKCALLSLDVLKTGLLDYRKKNYD